MRALLFTGATGFIGSEVLARLLKDTQCPEKIFLLLRKRPDTLRSLLARRFSEHGLTESVWSRLEFVETSFENAELFQKSLNELSTAYEWSILHMAAIIKSSSENSAQDRLNIGVTQDILNWGNRIQAKMFYYLSSVVAFGASENERPRGESDYAFFDPINQTFSYNLSKRLAHDWVLSHAKIPYGIFCPSVVHGSLEGSKNSRGHLKALRERRLPFAPSGGANFVSLDLVAREICRAVLESGPQKSFTRLLVEENMTWLQYMQTYVDLYFPEGQAPRLRSFPSVLQKIARKLHVVLSALGIRLSVFEALAQSSLYLYFKSEEAYSPSEGGFRQALKDSLQEFR